MRKLDAVAAREVGSGRRPAAPAARSRGTSSGSSSSHTRGGSITWPSASNTHGVGRVRRSWRVSARPSGPHHLAGKAAGELAVQHDRHAVHDGRVHALAPRLEPPDAAREVVHELLLPRPDGRRGRRSSGRRARPGASTPRSAKPTQRRGHLRDLADALLERPHVAVEHPRAAGSTSSSRRRRRARGARRRRRCRSIIRASSCASPTASVHSGLSVRQRNRVARSSSSARSSIASAGATPSSSAMSAIERDWNFACSGFVTSSTYTARPQRRRHGGALRGVAVVVLDRLAQLGARAAGSRSARDPLRRAGACSMPVPARHREVVEVGLVDHDRTVERPGDEHRVHRRARLRWRGRGTTAPPPTWRWARRSCCGRRGPGSPPGAR